MLISSPKYGLITLASINPENISGLLLPGSHTLFCERDFGTMLIQQFNTENYFLRYSIFNIFKKITLLFAEEKASLRIQLALKSDLNIKTRNEGKLHLREGQFVLLRGWENDETTFFDKGREYRFFDTSFSVDMIMELVAVFPSLNEFINVFASPKPLLRIKQPRSASPEITDIVYDLLKCPHNENLRRLYFENKTNDYLFEVLFQTYKIEPIISESAQKEKDAVFNARDIILNDLTKHFTIRELSQQVRLNEYKLKTGFKQEFGTGLFEYLIQARMQEARRLLIETDKPIKEIASLTGYEFLTNFINAFRKYFDYTPASLRRK